MAKKPKRPTTTSADQPWKTQWPRSADVREWMHALLRLTDFMESPRDRTESTVACALGELAELDAADQALAHAERIAANLPAAATYERARILFVAAEVAHDADDFERMEEYLRRTAEIAATAPKKRERADREQAIHRFRRDRGLLPPRDAATAEERIIATFRALMRDAALATKAGDAKSAVQKLTEAETISGQMHDWRQASARQSLVLAYHKAGDTTNLGRLLKLDDRAERPHRLYPFLLLKIGQYDRAVTRYESEADEALRELQTETMNAHFPASAVERAICGLADMGETDRAKRLLARTLQEGRTWPMAARGVFSAAVLKSIAQAVARIEGREAALSLVKLALDRAAGDKQSDWRTEAIRSNVELLIDLSPPEEAVALASKVRSPASRRQLLAKIYASREDWGNLHAVLNTCKNPKDAADLIWWTKFVWRPAK